MRELSASPSPHRGGTHDDGVLGYNIRVTITSNPAAASTLSRADSAPPRTCILGTAGHIDHGKSSLVKALTGTDPDRLPEEQSRGMTIELGFARLELPGVRMGIVDVPGHERFVRTMVSGATGIDLGLLVVAADDGVMPQTREHVAILALLGVHAGVVAINKADRADAARLAAVTEQVAGMVRETPLATWPVQAVSATTGAGLEALRALLQRAAASLPAATESAIFRMAIDRVFAVAGRGTVVTGSVLRGRAGAGVTLELHPPGASCRVREVQTHGIGAEEVGPGQRAALNLTGIDRDGIERGMELATPGCLQPARYLDARVQLLDRRARGVPSFSRVRVIMGTWEQTATIVLLDREPAAETGDVPSEIAPGGAGYVQLRFRAPVVAAQGQRFILRDESAQQTLGGGVVLNPVSRRIARREAVAAATALRVMDRGDARTRTAEAVRTAGFEALGDLALACRAGVEPREAAALRETLAHEKVLVDAGGRSVHRAVLESARNRGIEYLRRRHAQQPQAPGIPTERFVGWLERRAAAGMGKWLLAALQRDGDVLVQGPFAFLKTHRAALSPEDGRLIDGMIAELTAAGMDPPEFAKLACVAGQSRPRQTRLADLARSDPRLVMLAPGHFASAESVAAFAAAVRELGAGGRRFKLADVRDRLKLSRRPVQTMLEYMDRTQATRRIGDERVVN